jgi:hypothetical protein
MHLELLHEHEVRLLLPHQTVSLRKLIDREAGAGCSCTVFSRSLAIPTTTINRGIQQHTSRVFPSLSIAAMHHVATLKANGHELCRSLMTSHTHTPPCIMLQH